MPLLEVKDLKTYLYLRRGVLKAVNGVSFSVDRGQTLGIVGESGSGKSMTTLSIVRLLPASARSNGRILFDGEDLLAKDEREMREFRGRRVSLILQDPLSSLNPVFTIGDQVAEGIVTHDRVTGKPLRARVVELLRRLGIPAPEARAEDYPHQFSGGMRQRIVGAISIACGPQLLIADEPTTALDVTIQMQYLNLLKEIQKRDNLGMIFITHDFGIVAKMCDRVAVMYAGRILEMADVADIFDHPLHPYTSALVRSVPKVDERVDRLYTIPGEPPSLLNVPSACAFRARCAEVGPKCSPEEFPPEATVANNHTVRCWKYA